MNIGILFGGVSPEHEVSIITAIQTAKALENKEIYPLYIDKKGILNYVKDIDIEYFKNNEHKKHFINCNFIHQGIKIGFKKIKLDCVIICQHGLNGEDGQAAAILNFYDILYVGSPLISSAITIDKFLSYLVLKEYNIPVLETKNLYEHEEIKTSDFQYPLIIKPARLGSSIGISKIEEESKLREALELAYKFDNKVCIQKYLENAEEYNIAILKFKNEIHVSKIEKIESKHEFLTYDDKYQSRKLASGHNLAPEIDDEFKNKIIVLAKKTYLILECSGIVRIDFLVKDKIYVNEVNSIPGSMANYLFDEKFSDLLNKLIHQAFFEKQQKKQFLFTSNILQNDFKFKK